MEEHRDDETIEKEIPKFRGLYRYVRISVRALDWIIVACIAAILLVFFFSLDDLGFTVSFDARGGTDVVSQTQMWGEKLDVPEPPTREGYTFTGWYKDFACQETWDFESDTVEVDATLYAGWEQTE